MREGHPPRQQVRRVGAADRVVRQARHPLDARARRRRGPDLSELVPKARARVELRRQRLAAR